MSLSSQKPSLRSILAEGCEYTQLRSPAGQRAWVKRNQEARPKRRQGALKEATYMNDVIGSFLCSAPLGVSPHPLSPGVLPLPCFCLNKPFLSVLAHLCYISNNKLCTYIYGFCLCDKCVFHWGKDPGKIGFEPLALAGLGG